MNHEKQAKHTPGPWKVCGHDVAGDYDHFKEGVRVAISTICEKEERDANARLIASAPELLDALQSLLDCPDLNLDRLEDDTIKAIELAENAIKKAKGFQQ